MDIASKSNGNKSGNNDQTTSLFKNLMESPFVFITFSMVIIISVFTYLAPQFLSVRNFLNMLVHSSVLGITAVGMTFVIMTGGIDISVGSVAALIGIVVAKLLHAEIPTGIAVLIVIILGALIGAFNGFVITKLKISPFIVTLAMLAIARGAAFAITLAMPVHFFPKSFQFLGIGYIGPIPFAVLLMVVVFMVGYYLLNMTTFGRKLYVIGGNQEGARLSGIKVDNTILFSYILCSLMAAISGVTLTARLNTAWATAAQGLEFQAITSVVIGGGSLFGARGSMLGTFLGVMVIGLLNNGLSILNVSAFEIQLVNGIIIFLVVLLDRLKVSAGAVIG